MLELEAPLKIVGNSDIIKAISMVTSPNSSISSKCQAIQDKSAIYFSAIMLIEVPCPSSVLFSSYAIKSDTLNMFFCWEGTIKLQIRIDFSDFTKSANKELEFLGGRRSIKFLVWCLFVLWFNTKYSAFMEDSVQSFKRWVRYLIFKDP